MKVTLKTREKLIKEGWRTIRDGMYLGEKVSESKYKIGLFTLCYLLGEEVIVKGWLSNDRDSDPRLKVIFNDHEIIIPWILVDGALPPKKSVEQLRIKKKIGDKDAFFFRPTKTFEFSCSFSSLKLADARKWARWVLSIK